MKLNSLSPEVFNHTVIDRINNKTNSISQEDYAIAQANDDYALTTSFTNAIGNEIANVEKTLGKVIQRKREKLDKLEKLSAVMNSPSIYQYKNSFANLVANNATNLLQVFKDLGADKDSYPFRRMHFSSVLRLWEELTDAGQAKTACFYFRLPQLS